MPRTRINPPTPDEGPLENVKNGLNILWSIEEAPEMFSRSEVREMVKAVIVRLDAACRQLESFKWTGSGFIAR